MITNNQQTQRQRPHCFPTDTWGGLCVSSMSIFAYRIPDKYIKLKSSRRRPCSRLAGRYANSLIIILIRYPYSHHLQKNEGAVEGGGKKILLVHPQPDRRHETTTNRKSVKHWSSDCIGGIPRVSLLSYDDITNEAV